MQKTALPVEKRIKRYLEFRLSLSVASLLVINKHCVCLITTLNYASITLADMFLKDPLSNFDFQNVL